MLKFILRRLGISLFVLWGGSVLIYVLTINAGDPLADLRESNAENREYLMERRIAFMGLDQPWYARYWDWLRGVLGCLRLECDLGVTRNGTDVISLLDQAAQATLRLVILSTLLAIVIGVAVGIVTALRQYTGFDYGATFLAFLFFSLPVFWAAVLLKEFGAIRFNDWIADPQVGVPTILAIALVLALVAQAVTGGDLRRRGSTAGVTFVFVTGAMLYFDLVNWYRQPALGVALVAIVGLAAAVLLVSLLTGFRNRKVLVSAVTTVVAVTVLYVLLRGVLADPTWPVLLAVLAGFVAVGVVTGVALGGYARRRAVFVSTVSAVVMCALVVTDLALSSWAGYLQIQSRPISTIGAQTPNFEGTFWEDFLDKGTQLLLPTILLTLISVAAYSRYTRSSMLEVLEQDYIRTARSKGLAHRTVVTKHAFRNALIPITTIVAFDFAGLIGGAVITEQVFGWSGMGDLFRVGLDTVDPAPVMAFYLVTAVAAVVMNMVADIAYAYLDPRIRR